MKLVKRPTTAQRFRIGDSSWSAQLAAMAGMLAVLASCGPPTGPKAVTQLTVHAGGGQTTAAGTPVPIPPAVLASDKRGNPVPGVPITFSVETGGGSVTGANATTNQNGIATLGAWILGNGLGEQRLIAEVDGYQASATVKATSEVGPPATIEKLAGDLQTATAGRPVPLRPKVRVKDSAGNSVSGAGVTFTVSVGGGTIEGNSTTTGSTGEAILLGWTLGAIPGSNAVTATSSDASTVFTATGLTGPTSVMINAGNDQTGPVGIILPVAPEVLVSDALGNPLEGITVTFAVARGGGSLSANTAVTDAGGLAWVRWTLGTTTETNSMYAQVGDLPVPYFFATAVARAPAMLTPAAGNNQAVLAGKPVPVSPSVFVSDEFGNPVANISVDFTATSGGGSVTGSPAISGTDGIAGITGWTVGTTPGTNTLQAVTGALTPAVFTATGLGSGYDIELVFLTGVSPTQRQAFENAAARWQELIAGDLANISFAAPDTVDSNSCTAGQPVIKDLVIDDLRIYVSLEAIDGPGNVVGNAGPCVIRDGDSLPVVGSMRFDTDDLANMETSGLLDPLILHEMGHVIGVGTMWRTFQRLQNESSGSGPYPDTHFDGPRAISAFDSIGGASYSGARVPVEQTGGDGTRNSHWRESVFDTELMTGWLDSGTNQLSAVSVASLGDFGYVVNVGAADAFTVPFAGPAAVVAAEALGIFLGNDARQGPLFVVNRTGRIVRIVPEE